MMIINDCPRCGKDFMRDAKWDYQLERIDPNDITKLIFICQDCNEKDQEAKKQRDENEL